jgi:cytochrome c
MLALRAHSDGIEIEFTEPLPEGTGWNAQEYTVRQWRYQPTADYGGPKLDLENLRVRSANVSDDRLRVFLELEGMKENHVVYLRLPNHWTSAEDKELWSTESWYTMNRIPPGKPGFKKNPPPPIPHNTLTDSERAGGWKLLFDGKTTAGWRNYNKKTIGTSWKAVDGALMLDARRDDKGQWVVEDGGDIITENQYQDFELKLEWKISACGNSGIFFNVIESDEYDTVWKTGPEVQVLDDACHPDARFENHRAGSLYDMIAVKYPTVYPAGEWNKVRILSKEGRVELWLNGRKTVEFEMFTDEWRRMIAGSKFKDMPGFGKSPKGYIALQDK